MAVPPDSSRSSLLYICIPVYNEAPTVGLVLWRLRKVFQDYARDYEVVVYDDGSTDSTRETLEGYADALPLTIIHGSEHRGYAHALDALARAVSAKTRYPRRDGLILMQGDFTDQPEHLPELIKRFEGGADIVVGEREPSATAPTPVRRLRWASAWLGRFLVAVPGITDPFGSLRLYRISLVRDALKAGTAPLAEGAGWAANADLLVRLAAHARRIETVAVSQRFDLRPRETRVRPWADALALVKHGRRSLPAPAPAKVG
jgi:glycosyltransferase involved in cell wall biosynthesis